MGSTPSASADQFNWVLADYDGKCRLRRTSYIPAHLSTLCDCTGAQSWLHHPWLSTQSWLHTSIGYILLHLSTLRDCIGAQSWLRAGCHFCAELATSPLVIHAELATHSYIRVL